MYRFIDRLIRLLYYLPMEMKVERNYTWNKYTFTPEDEKDEKLLDRIAQLEEENKKLKEENEKLHDEFMLKLAEAFLLPPTSNQMAVYKQWNYSKWYDEIKNQMRKEIKEWS